MENSNIFLGFSNENDFTNRFIRGIATLKTFPKINNKKIDVTPGKFSK